MDEDCEDCLDHNADEDRGGRGEQAAAREVRDDGDGHATRNCEIHVAEIHHSDADTAMTQQPIASHSDNTNLFWHNGDSYLGDICELSDIVDANENAAFNRHDATATGNCHIVTAHILHQSDVDLDPILSVSENTNPVVHNADYGDSNEDNICELPDTDDINDNVTGNPNDADVNADTSQQTTAVIRKLDKSNFSDVMPLKALRCGRPKGTTKSLNVKLGWQKVFGTSQGSGGGTVVCTYSNQDTMAIQQEVLMLSNRMITKQSTKVSMAPR